MNKIKSSRFADICGWYGMTALITAYALVSFGIIPGQGLAYQLLNMSGAIGLTVIALAKNVPQSVLLNVFWMIIGFVAIWKLL